MRSSAAHLETQDRSSDVAEMDLTRARGLVARGEDDAARQAYMTLLQRDPTHLQCLTELGALAFAGGFRSAARTLYEQAVALAPQNALTRVNLANVLRASDEPVAARTHYLAAIGCDPDFAEAHQGLAAIFSDEGDGESAAYHRDKGFLGRAIVRRPYRGTGKAADILLLVSALGGNIPTDRWLNDRRYSITAIYAEYADLTAPLPPHDLVVNAIGDADLCADGLIKARDICAATDRPVVNRPDHVIPTGRQDTARMIGSIPGVRAPTIRALSAHAIRALETPAFPVLVRQKGFHTGQHFHRAEDRPALDAILGQFDQRGAGDLLLIDYLDACGADGKARKYRMMFIDGALYPIHLAVSHHWKVHYFTAAMADDASYRAEEARFLADPAGVIGETGMAALNEIAARLGLDYAGIDFGLDADGALLVFEVNATMVLIPPAADPVWDYRRPAIARAFEAVDQMLHRRLNR